MTYKNFLRIYKVSLTLNFHNFNPILKYIKYPKITVLLFFTLTTCNITMILSPRSLSRLFYTYLNVSLTSIKKKKNKSITLRKRKKEKSSKNFRQEKRQLPI